MEHSPDASVDFEYFVAVAQPKRPCPVLLVPGGAYEYIGLQYDGNINVKWLTQNGYDTILVKNYTTIKTDGYPVGDRAKRDLLAYLNNFEGKSLIVLAFSAGFHPAYLASVQHLNVKAIVGVYPITSMEDDLCHHTSRNNLLGKEPTKDQIKAIVWRTQLMQVQTYTEMLPKEKDRTSAWTSISQVSISSSMI
ncbi:hypothetical protein F4808DRAFT_472793 [Astrocystis sublimbata]|nr:hypothetical protein F4808DRAFT_468972 [Astrocystis sublimbata]KAI0198500.1 hypothetical protein F4808DRAFT_472793 [Astrocystis sublimbata]